MKKVSKLSLTLASIGVFMIGLAGVLQYKAYETLENTVSYEKVTMKDVNAGKEEVNTNKVNKNEEAVTSNDNQEVVSEDDSNDSLAVEEVVIEEELEDVKTYEEVNTVPVDPIVYDGLTMNQLAEKLNRSLNSTILERVI